MTGLWDGGKRAAKERSWDLCSVGQDESRKRKSSGGECNGDPGPHDRIAA